MVPETLKFLSYLKANSALGPSAVALPFSSGSIEQDSNFGIIRWSSEAW